MQYLQNKLTFSDFYGNIKEMCSWHMDPFLPLCLAGRDALKAANEGF